MIKTKYNQPLHPTQDGHSEEFLGGLIGGTTKVLGGFVMLAIIVAAIIIGLLIHALIKASENPSGAIENASKAAEVAAKLKGVKA